MKLLLTSVFGPFGVDDEYGRSDNKMELFHNQVTREQGLFSYRFHHASFGLYFLAENIQTPTTVLDFPSLDEFKAEIQKGYDYIGISFIIPNFTKAQTMARLVRELAPTSKIILGGHGTNAPGADRLIEYDHFCRGEGVYFLRDLLGEDLNRPIKHPLMHSSYNKKVMGVSIPDESGIIISGVGCQNKCRFCATSHFFGSYTSYLKTGRDIFDICCRYEKEMGITDFGVMDENFLKDTPRALELIELMERTQRFFTFGIFSSAETLQKFESLDMLVRLGVTFIWMGVESKKEAYEKNHGTNFEVLVKELRDRGISVMTSVILFSEDHDHVTINDDIDFAISLRSDYVQYMQLGPIPGTSLYDHYKEKGLILADVPFEEQHGQDRIWFKHHAFSREETKTVLKDAFKKEYDSNGASFIRMIDTTLRGFRYTSTHTNPHIRARATIFAHMLKLVRLFLPATKLWAENASTSRLAAHLTHEFKTTFGTLSLKDRVLSFGIIFISLAELLRIRLWSDRRHPPGNTVEYARKAISIQNNSISTFSTKVELKTPAFMTDTISRTCHSEGGLHGSGKSSIEIQNER